MSEYGSTELETQKAPLLTKKQSVRRRKPLPGRAEPSQLRQRQLIKLQSKPVLSKIFNASDVAETNHGLGHGHHHHHHSFIYTALNPKSNQKPARIFKWFIATVILVDLLFFIVSTEPNLPQRAQYIFIVAEGVTSSIFLVEYILRLVTCTESRKYKGAVMGRLKYMVTPSALIDCFATFPFFIERFTGWDLPTLTYLRVFRLLRIGKTQGYGKALDAVYRVIYYNREILHVALLVCTFLVLLTAILMYYLRPQNPQDAQDFTSIAATMYLSTLMLTGQGGPGGDLPWYTKAVVLLTGVFSVAMFAIPVSG
jgi:voltage-gated potassium channel